MGNGSETDVGGKAPILAPGAYAVGDRVSRVSGVLCDVQEQTEPDIGGASDTGRRRQKNEDHYLIARLTRGLQVTESSVAATDTLECTQGWLMLVADGIGGHEAGEIASEMAVSAVAERVLSAFPWNVAGDRAVSDLNHAAEVAFEKCQALITEYAEVCGVERAPGTTLTVAFVVWPVLHVFHVGDSRCYLQRGEALTQLTVDQNYYSYATRAGIGAPNPAFKSLLANSLGAGKEGVEVEAHAHCLKRGDKLLLCTDGVTNHLQTADLLDALTSSYTSARTCATQLVEAANARGGSDNLTAVVAAF